MSKPDRSADIEAQKYDPKIFLENTKSFDLNKVPCAKESLIKGAMAGGTIGIIRFLRTKYIASAISWSVGGFLFASVASLEYCRRNRDQAEAELQRTIETMKQYRETNQQKVLPYKQDRDVSEK
eukprot:TRINITY_DN4420_c0_g1_i1.p1 TRINITY_DN4420_c0_g1~~TRINITY_DN4420_c0_g1_i1.p1  ORF type:complete len:124 (+),score=5.95 TRINITY_DN4420_c0_g1_i1:94-465(+)